jgi:hypothetical protein
MNRNQTFYMLRAAGRIRDAYEVVPEFFEDTGILIVCLDSNRALRKSLGLFRHHGIDAVAANNSVLVGGKEASKLFATEGLMVGFSAVYLLASPGRIPERPDFDLTTDVDEAFEPGRIRPLLTAMSKAGACGYFADGCGLVAVVTEHSIAARLVSNLRGTTIELQARRPPCDPLLPPKGG